MGIEKTNKNQTKAKVKKKILYCLKDYWSFEEEVRILPQCQEADWIRSKVILPFPFGGHYQISKVREQREFGWLSSGSIILFVSVSIQPQLVFVNQRADLQGVLPMQLCLSIPASLEQIRNAQGDRVFESIFLPNCDTKPSEEANHLGDLQKAI